MRKRNNSGEEIPLLGGLTVWGFRVDHWGSQSFVNVSEVLDKEVEILRDMTEEEIREGLMEELKEFEGLPMTPENIERIKEKLSSSLNGLVHTGEIRRKED
jgi:hypothetical protein